MELKSNLRNKKIKIFFMGTPGFAADILKNLIEANFNVAAISTQPDKKAGRKQKVLTSPVKKLAEQKKIKVFQPENLRDEKTVEEIKKINPDVIVVAAYGKILPMEILRIPPFGCLNIHASLLPKLRGASPVQNAILQGGKKTGVTLMLMNEGVDTGDILAQEKVIIKSEDTAETLLNKLSVLGGKMLVKHLPRWISGKIKPKPQDNKKASYCQLIKKSDGKIDWTQSAQEIYDRWRAFYLWPGIHSLININGQLKKIKLLRVSINPKLSLEKRPGKILKHKEKIAVQAKRGVVFLEEVQLEGKKKVSIQDFIRGYPNFIGSKFSQ